MCSSSSSNIAADWRRIGILFLSHRMAISQGAALKEQQPARKGDRNLGSVRRWVCAVHHVRYDLSR